MTHQSRKLQFWVWLTVASLIPGVLSALIFGTTKIDGYSLSGFLFGIVIFTCIFEILFFVAFKLGQHVLRNLFSKRSLIELAVLGLLVAIFYVEEDWRGAHAWQTYERAMEAQGEKYDFDSFVPPPVPDDQNFALTPIVASSYSRYLDRNGNLLSPPNTNIVNRLEMSPYSLLKPNDTNLYFNWSTGIKADLKAWQTYYQTPITNADLTITNDFPTTPTPQSSAKDVLLALSRFNPAIEELRQASRLKYSRFPLHYDAAMPLISDPFYIGPIAECRQVLRLKAVAELQDDQSAMAWDDVKLMLYLATAIEADPLPGEQRERTRLVDYAIQPVWEGLVAHKWSNAQLVAIQNELSQYNFLNSYQLQAQTICAGTISALEYQKQKRNLDFLPLIILKARMPVNFSRSWPVQFFMRFTMPSPAAGMTKTS